MVAERIHTGDAARCARVEVAFPMRVHLQRDDFAYDGLGGDDAVGYFFAVECQRYLADQFLTMRYGTRRGVKILHD